MVTKFNSIAFLLLALAGAASLGQTTQPAGTQPQGQFEVQQWAVFVLDAAQGQLNPNGIVGSTLPDFMVTRRTAAVGDLVNRPQPLGIIRLFGHSDSKVDITIGRPLGGDFLASWPAAEARSNQLLWRDLDARANPPALGAEPLGMGNWFSSLGRSDAEYLSVGNTPAQRFLMFDVTMPYFSALKVRTAKDLSVELRNAGKSPLRHLTLYYQQSRQLWLEAAAGDVLPEDQSAAQTRPSDATLRSEKVQLAPASAASPALLAGAWKLELGMAGLSGADCNMIVSILQANAFSGQRLTAVYRMDDAELERLMPLDVVPQTQRIVRVALVIVKNVDPLLGSDIDDLIAELGDPLWAKREEAYQALKAMGHAAEVKLNQAQSNPDAEIAWRAERLVDEMNNPSGR
jgi:hypothetical protein